MPSQAPRAPLSVYMLADHLDGALAAGEDLVAEGVEWRTLATEADQHGAAATTRNHRDCAENVRSFELQLVGRILRARDHARDLGELDSRFRPVTSLFVSGTAILLDAVDEAGDARAIDFETGDGLHAYMRSRNLIAPDAASLTNPDQLLIDDTFMVAKRIALGPLMDMIAALLDALDAHYELFDSDASHSEAPSSEGAAPHSLMDALDRLNVN